MSVLSEAENAQWLRLASAGASVGAGAESAVTPSYVSPDPGRRQQVLQSLSEFRAAYKQLAPSLTVSASSDMESRWNLAQRIGQDLSQYGLGQAGEADALPFQNGQRAALVFRGAREDAEVIRRMLAALSPYLAGDVLVMFDNSLRADQWELHLLGEPRFTDEGVAVFSNRAISP